MASSENQGGSVLVQHASPPHALSPEVTVVSISAFSPGSHIPPSPLPDAVADPTFPSRSPQPDSRSTTPAPELRDTEMADAPLSGPDISLEPEQEAVTESAVSQEQSHTAEETDVPEPTHEADHIAGQDTEGQPSTQEGHIPPPPPAVVQEPRPDVPVWATWEDDLSTPTDDEMEELRRREATGTEMNALDVPNIEKRIYQDVDDPEQRPVKKLRLNWVVKGVRGTKDNPNHARVMVSPAAKVDGNYWQIKFYPRGNKCSSLSAYIKCSRHPPKPDQDIPEGTFSFFEGPPDAELGTGATPSHSVTIESRPRGMSGDRSADPVTSSGSQKSDDHNLPAYPIPDIQQGTDSESLNVTDMGEPVEEDWRVPAQLGMVMYNPEEPRTCTYMSSQHQFAKSNDDWGWTDFVGPWSDIHIRQHLQRRPLLQNDTLAIDAYILIFEDPSQALWWHSSDTEAQWDSKSLAGYYPMGTPSLHHSPAVAGMTAWLLLVPFRKVIQGVNAGERRRNSRASPKTVINQLQMILYLMRSQTRERYTYVNVNAAIQAIEELGETYGDVKTFWKVLRRSIELELEGDHASLQQLSNIFDTPDGDIDLPPLPVQGVQDIQAGLEQVLAATNFKGHLPNFLPLSLARQRFDPTSRDWKLLRDRVILNEELDVSKYCTEGEQARYTLYGFVVHVGGRTSGKFYSVLRPGGPNTKWLAFEDGDGNKIFSYTRKRIQDFEGFEGQALADSNLTGRAAYMAMYIKTSCLSEYLSGRLESYTLPGWLGPSLQAQHAHGDGTLENDPDNEDTGDMDVEVYSDEGIIGWEGPLNMFAIKEGSRQQDQWCLLRTPRSTTFEELRHQVSRTRGLEDPQKIRLFHVSDMDVGRYLNPQMIPVNLQDTVSGAGNMDQPLCLWMSILKNQEDIDLFAEHDRPHNRQQTQVTQLPESGPDDVMDDTDEEHLAAPDVEQASVHAAVSADVDHAAERTGQPPAALGEINDPDTPMQMEMPPPTAEESLTADVPHGHLIDAAAHPDEVSAGNTGSGDEGFQSSDGDAIRLSPAEEAIVATAIAGDAGLIVVMDAGAEGRTTNNAPSESSESSDSSESASAEPQEQPRCIYGFIQIFDVDKQTLSIRSAFFARRDRKMKEVIRQHMGWTTDKEFNVWRRQSAVQGVTVEPDQTFQDDEFHDGMVLIVGEPVPEARVKELHKEGNFSDPFDLSSYLRMVARKHPVASKTTRDPIELAEFGSDYYKGPLVNGRAHGEHCLCISSSGETYEGPLECNKKCGRGGKMTYRNGDTYDGEWDDDERHGQGTFVEHRTGNKYVGGFEYGKRWGMGTTYWQVADEQADLCQICYGQEIDALFFDCGHVCSCVECAKQCDICPICRKTVKQVVKMFRA